MRCTQVVGLKKEAHAFLRDNVAIIPCDPCPHCGKMTKEKWDCCQQKENEYGMFDENVPMMSYRLKSGEIVHEHLQTTIWNSGPMLFFCLETDKGKMIFTWTDEEIESEASE